MAQIVKNQPAMHETRVQALGQEDSLEKGMAAHSSILAWRLPWTEEPGRLPSTETHSTVVSESDTTKRLILSLSQHQKGKIPVFTELTGRRGGRQQTEAHEKHWAHGVSEQEA